LPVTVDGKLVGTVEAAVHFAPNPVGPPVVVGNVAHFFPEFAVTPREFASAK
jgi:hypothetical protein